MFGIINVNKPYGLTSHDVVARMRKILGMKQIGHTGTLDPMATGVLPICAGKATRVIDYLIHDKAYRATVKLGITTDTYDMEGQVLTDVLATVDRTRVAECLKEFEGDIEQLPPMYSAIHYKGKRLYEYARQDVSVLDEIPKRKVHVSSIELVEVLNEDTAHPELVIDVECSGGTYIRSIAYDLGQMLGFGACLSGLVRTKACGFDISGSLTLEEIAAIKDNGKLDEILTNPVCNTVLKCCKIDECMLDKIKHGQSIRIQPDEGQFSEDERIQLIFEDALAAIAVVKANQAFPKVVFI